jgi:predicted nucleic acid-binding protein
MRPVVLDTNAYVAFKRGDDDVLAVLRRAERLWLPVVVLGELLAGFAAGNREAANREALAAFLESPRVATLPVTDLTADHYALIFADLRRKGRPIPSNDLWIAASTLEQGAALLTLDAHFAAVDGLRTGRRLADFLP